jgi:hypothetical protein
MGMYRRVFTQIYKGTELYTDRSAEVWESTGGCIPGSMKKHVWVHSDQRNYGFELVFILTVL